MTDSQRTTCRDELYEIKTRNPDWEKDYTGLGYLIPVVEKLLDDGDRMAESIMCDSQEHAGIADTLVELYGKNEGDRVVRYHRTKAQQYRILAGEEEG